MDLRNSNRPFHHQYTLFPCCFQENAVLGNSCWNHWSIIDDDHYHLASMQNICYGYNCMFVIGPTFVRIFKVSHGLQVFLYHSVPVPTNPPWQVPLLFQRRMVIRCFTRYSVVLVCNEMVYSPEYHTNTRLACSYASTVPLSKFHSHVSILIASAEKTSSSPWNPLTLHL